MELKPLYLAAGHQWRVSHEERALRVEGEGRAPSWYPFRRLGRVVSATDVNWRSDALLACLRAGVPVFFVDGHGNPQGYCFGPIRRETTLEGLLSFALGSSEWDLRYETWRTAMDRQLLLRAQRALSVRLRRLDSTYAEGCFCNAHYRRLGQPVSPLLRALNGAMHAQVAARLARDISATCLGYPRPGLFLADDFSELLRWDAHTMIGTMNQGTLRELGAERSAAHLLQQEKGVRDSLEQLIGSFEIWLRSWAL